MYFLYINEGSLIFYFKYLCFTSVISGYLVLAGRVRKFEEAETIREVLEKRLKRKVDLENLFTCK